MHLPPLMRAVRRFAVSRPEARRFAARAWVGAPVVQASLATLGLQSTLRWIETISAPRRGARADHDGPVSVAEGTALVSGAFRAHFVGGECLPRSLVQYLLHRLDGQPVRFVVGVKRPDGAPRAETLDDGGDPHTPASAIAAHAWVEAADEAAADPGFTPLFATGAKAA